MFAQVNQINAGDRGVAARRGNSLAPLKASKTKASEFTFFLDQLKPSIRHIPAAASVIGEASPKERKRWTSKGRVVGMSCALRQSSPGFNLWPRISKLFSSAAAIPVSEQPALAKSILKAVLKYRREFPKISEAKPTPQGGFTLWTQDFEFDPKANVNANEVYAGVTAVLWAGRQLLGKDFLIAPVPASSLFKNLGEFNTKQILRGQGKTPYLAALGLKGLPRNNPEGGLHREWNFLSMLYRNKLIDGFLGQQYSTNNPDALPGSVSKDTRHFYPRHKLPYAILSSYDDPPQLPDTTITNKPWKSSFQGALPFKAGIYFAGTVPKHINPEVYLSPSRQSLTSVPSLRSDAENLYPQLISEATSKHLDWMNEDMQAYVDQGDGGGRDQVIGSAYHDIIQSVYGRDRLIGGGGADLSPFGINDDFGQKGADIVKNFDPVQRDVLGLPRSFLKELNPLNRAIVTSQKQLRIRSQDDVNILYLETTGQLFYGQNGDADAMGKGGLFSRLDPSPSLQAQNLSLV